MLMTSISFCFRWHFALWASGALCFPLAVHAVLEGLCASYLWRLGGCFPHLVEKPDGADFDSSVEWGHEVGNKSHAKQQQEERRNPGALIAGHNITKAYSRHAGHYEVDSISEAPAFGQAEVSASDAEVDEQVGHGEGWVHEGWFLLIIVVVVRPRLRSLESSLGSFPDRDLKIQSNS